jgi:TRAP-type C4-dicarboxylate transport system permease small subunit
MVFGGARLMTITLYLGQTAAALQMPLGYIYLVLPLSGLLIAFYSALFFIDRWRSLSGQAPELEGHTGPTPNLNVD